MAGRRTPQRSEAGLATYRRKRHFGHTPEPAATSRAQRPAAAGRTFVIHLHHARRRHFDLRLQVGGVLRSWAVPKGPSRDPSIRHLAVQVEDHPLSYGSFEGTIPEGHYGAGTVAIWDEGTWSTEGSAAQQIDKGHLRFELHGARLHGHWSLVRTRVERGKAQWLLIKGDDEFVVPGDVADDTPLSEWKAEHGIADTQRKPRARRATRKAAALPAPDAFEFELARLYPRAPEGEDWLHEVKYDGYRMLAWRNGRDLQLLSRNRLDWTDKLPAIAQAILALDCHGCVLDGELVVFDESGRSRFDLLQKEFNRAQAEAVRYAVFDLLALNGDDLRDAPLLERKAALSRLLEYAEANPSTSPLVVSGFLRGNGALAYKRACEAGLEGIIAKSANAPYRGGRGDAWRKLKCIDSDEFVIVGYTPGKGSRGALGALLLAEPRGKQWRYVGRVGTGMDTEMLERLHAKLKPAKHKPELIDAPNAKQLRGGRPVWVEPDTVVEIAFRGRTGDDFLRQGSFKGLRPDKSPADLRDSDRAPKESSMPARKTSSKARAKRAEPESGINLTHPDRVLIEKPRVTKQGLAEFYASIADHLLPGVIGRPLSLVRCPDGAGGECFFQKHPMTGMPEAIGIGDARSAEGKKQEYVYVKDIEGVIGLVQMNVIEIHPWGSTIADLEHPDRIVFDLDPDTGVEWPRVRDAARTVRERLQAVGLESFLRTTGGKGVHVVVPLNPRPDWETAKAFAHALARTLEQESPKDFVSVATKNRRKGRIFVDYLRNARGSTAVASYCVRARPGAGVATPLRWEELARLKSGAQYTFDNIARRLKTMKQDPWQGFDEVRQALPQSRGA
ncbi:MAG: ATP-dependent DNA ligase clustered with Ku protein, LigD [Rhodanobacteraceae bacterium]|jgi:bifunctional non-homologous end joining protein LigD|nr:MAG: ATP-dependent DNA ligase clustered with Ku protein, LigD [Rhodanobacteraceae bacterium]